MSRKRVPLNQNECTANFRIGVPFEQNLHILTLLCGMVSGYLMYQEYQIKSGIEKLQGEVANETISLIGGADGPTRVFLAGKITFPVRPDILFVITLLLLAATAFYFMQKIKKNKKK